MKKLKHYRAIRAIAAVLCINLDEAECNIDIETKFLMAIVYGVVNGTRLLRLEFRKVLSVLGKNTDVTTLNAVSAFASEETDFKTFPDFKKFLPRTNLTETQKLVLYIGKSSAYLPTRTTSHVVRLVETRLMPAEVIELISWTGVLTVLHRLYVFYFPNCMDRSFLKYARAARTDLWTTMT